MTPDKCLTCKNSFTIKHPDNKEHLHCKIHMHELCSWMISEQGICKGKLWEKKND